MKEYEIRKKKTYEKLLSYTRQDAFKLAKKCSINIKCYSCDKVLMKKFIKSGFQYSECNTCNALFANPRPNQNSMNEFYKNSKTSNYFKIFYQENLMNRISKIWKPKKKIILNFFKKNNIQKANIIDLGAGYGAFLDLLKVNKNFNLYGVEPSETLVNSLKKKKINSINKFAEDLTINDLPSGRNVFVSFELIEHLQNPLKFFKKISKLSKKNDYLIFTTLSGTGIDIRDLWQNSNSICPPQHLNFFNPNSIKIILEKNKYKVLDITTPGKLDLSILENNIKHINSDFLKKFLKFSTAEEKLMFQKFLVKAKLSSHLMVFAKKI
tara:strand:+ start:3664 stop:4635 length:972 start_codon:yes stop_codon:yes gene_type:complete